MGGICNKPYAVGNYINKMSNHCADCRFDVKIKTGDGAALQLPFCGTLSATGKALGKRSLGNVQWTWSKMSTEKQNSYIDSAADILGKL